MNSFNYKNSELTVENITISKIAEEIKNKKENLSEKEIYLLQKLAGVKDPKK